ncbi:type II secretion system pseudopilin PulG [Sulfurimicrobium lacus]|uniref:Type II secretion system pseudopilin PulG n=1 Tax=Sulfurimicrobium lacus TaxID=2715678 RepID=A0A6F8VD09_9PROT|nr:type II secretion system protein [Sulfurimicrobium lacus]BCB27608.1 type II secretion system pseudopilin PulG [Sulfurimicrobium lacus]
MIRRAPAGFTLIELVVTVAIVGLLASVALPMMELVVQRDKEQELRLDLRQIRSAIDAYKEAVDEGRVKTSMQQTGYPPTLNVLVEGVPDQTDPDGKRMIYFLRRIPRDPMSDDPANTNDETWGKRSYASSADSPEAGDDVYDVYSLSSGVGLNGISYKDW